MLGRVGELPRKPKIHAYFDIIFMETDCCQVRSGDDVILVLRGRTVSEVLPQLFEHLDGSLNLRELAEACSSLVSKEDLLEILQKLNSEGILEDADVEVPLPLTAGELKRHTEQLLFLSHFETERYQFQSRLKGSKVAIIGTGALGSAVLSSLAGMGAGHLTAIETAGGSGNRSSREDTYGPTATASPADRDPDTTRTIVDASGSAAAIDAAVGGCDVVAVATDKLEPSIYDEINRISLADGIPWIICSPLNSIEGAVGPFFVPHETCCYRCYELRAKSNLSADNEYIAYEEHERKKNGRTADYGHLLPFPMVLGNLMALEVVKHITKFALPETYGRVLSFNFLTLEARLHDVLKLPRCQDCSPSRGFPPLALWSK